MTKGHLAPFPTVWDSTIRSAFVACPRQFFWGYLNHLRKSGLSVHLHFGGCFAKGLEVTRKSFYAAGESASSALIRGCNAIVEQWGEAEFPDVPPRSPAANKTLPSCIDALASYFEEWPLAEDRLQPYRFNGVPAVEMSFAVPIVGTAHPVTGDPLIYAGRFDMLGYWEDADSVFICDEKTSSNLGNAWINNWKMRGQLTGYVFGARQYGLNAAGCIVRGIGILKSEITFTQVIETRPEWQVQQWLSTLRYDLNRAAAMWAQAAELETPRNAFPQALDSACSSYGGCPFLDLCDSEHPERWIGEYDTLQWDPLRRVGE